MKRPALVHGEYSGNGYEVWIGGRLASQSNARAIHRILCERLEKP